jgi:hypothetical protein
MSSDLPNNGDLINFIATTVETMRDRMVTKDDLAGLATKTDLNRVETILRGDIEQVQVRLDSIDRALSTRMGQIESEVSRLRSVLYLLVKDSRICYVC